MPIFRDEEEVYRLIGGLLRNLAEDAQLAPELRQADTVAQFRYDEPQAVITVSAKPDEEPRVDCGPTDLEPELVMRMPADLAHRFWLGRVNVTVALARGEMEADGPVIKVLGLLPVLDRAFDLYRELLVDEDRADLLDE
jgi:hypothetical protein